MPLSRASSGLLLRDDFGSDTSANYSKTAGTLSVSSGRLEASSACGATRKTITGVLCATVRGNFYGGQTGTLLSQNELSSEAATIDIYSIHYDGANWLLRRLVNGSATTLATVATPDLDLNTYGVSRLYRSGTSIVGRFGVTTLAGSGSAVDTTYTTGLYGGPMPVGSAYRYADYLDLRTSHLITVNSLPAGSSVVVSDGTTTASADTTAGTATVDAGAVLFPLASISVYSSTGGGGSLLAQITSATLADMGGGDVFTYSGGSLWLPGADMDGGFRNDMLGGM